MNQTDLDVVKHNERAEELISRAVARACRDANYPLIADTVL
jgi:hypothetical protein